MKSVFRILTVFILLAVTATAMYGQGDPRNIYSTKVFPTTVVNVLANNNAQELRNRIVTTTSGAVYFVDWQGKSIILTNSNLDVSGLATKAKVKDDSIVLSNKINYEYLERMRVDDSLANAISAISPVNADWNATSGKGQILNKPQITSQWSFLGNNASPTDFLGTLNNVPLVLKSGGLQVAKFVRSTGEDTTTISVEFGNTNTTGSSANSGAVAMGKNTNALGNYSVSMGYGTNASGDNSVAMGNSTTASGDNSVAMGNSTTASGGSSFAMGVSTNSVGISSFAMGYGTNARGTNSASFGEGTDTENDNSIVMGSYNKPSVNHVFTIGSGNSAFKANSVSILNSGNMMLGGKYEGEEFNPNVGSNVPVYSYNPTEKLEVYGRIKAENLRFDLSKLPIRSDNTNASDLQNGDVYRTATGDLKIKY